MTEIKLCPFCAEEIKIAAIVCKHCGRDLLDNRNQPNTQTVERKPMGENEYSVPRLEMEIENLQDKRPSLENAANTTNIGCALLAVGGIIAVVLNIYFGVTLLIIGLVLTLSTSTTKEKAKKNLDDLDKQLKTFREALFKLKETGESFTILESEQAQKKSKKINKISPEEDSIAKEKRRKETNTSLIVVAVFFIVVLILMVIFR